MVASRVVTEAGGMVNGIDDIFLIWAILTAASTTTTNRKPPRVSRNFLFMEKD